MDTTSIILYSFLGGVLPTIIWLGFWLREDKLHPEPKKYIFLTFLFGIFSAILVLPLEEYIEYILTIVPTSGILAIILLSFSEELFKFLAAHFSALKKKVTDEPIDPIIYMITAALGFAALENSLFLMQSMKVIHADINHTILVGNMRFIGATLLHTVSSGALGFFMGFSFYKKKLFKKEYWLVGLILSVALHSFFNFFIMIREGEKIFETFALIWLLIVFLIFSFEIVKKIKKKSY
ncbi:MAG: PrsW family glutamic-type intramembrane protease [Patescibacteria group bacterium]